MSDNSELFQRLENLTNLPSPPRVALEIVALAREPEASLVAVAGVISRDPALVAKVLRVANSPLYRRRRKSETLRQALLALGLRTTMSLALGFSLAHALRRAGSHGLDYAAFWRRALMSSSAARSLAAALHRDDAEDLAVTALLQDIGMLAIDRLHPNLYAAMPADIVEHQDLADFERGQIGADHAEVGAWLCERWNLPDYISDAVRNSHRVRPIGEGQDADFLCTIALSGPVADLWLGEPSDLLLDRLASRAEAHLGLDFVQFASALVIVRSSLAETEALYETDLVNAQQADLLIERARELVMIRNLRAIEDTARLRQLGQRPDPAVDLTAVPFSRECLDERLADELRISTEQGWPVTVACLSVHAPSKDGAPKPAASAIIEQVGKLLATVTRDADLLAQHDERSFALLMPGTSMESATSACRRLVDYFAEVDENAAPGGVVRTILHAGIASHPAHGSTETAIGVIGRASQAMRDAVAQGRPVVSSDAVSTEPG